jgi:very-short-patch-repair endonuclease
MARLGRTAEQVIARIASRQHGVVTWAELRKEEITENEIRRRATTGALIAVYRGVYRVGHAAPSIEASFIAAVKACGRGAVLSGRAAAYLWGLIKGKPPPPEVTAPGEHEFDGIVTHRARAGIDRRDIRKRQGIPVTSIPRTIVDLAAEAEVGELARIFHEAAVKYRTRPEHVEEVLRRRPNAKGAKRLRAAMYGDQAVTLSELEDAFIALLRAANLPLPKTNKRKGGHLIDFRWPELGLTIELDSYRYHATRYAWERDHDRNRDARKRGDRLERFTWEDVFERPRETTEALRQLLSTPPS